MVSNHIESVFIVHAIWRLYQENGGLFPAVPHVKKRRGFPRRSDLLMVLDLPQELKHALLRLVGQRQRRDRDRLAGRQRLAVGGFLVGVGQRQVGCAGLQHVDQVLREVLADLHDRQVRTERRGFRAQRGGDVVKRRQHVVRRVAVQEVSTGGQGRKTE